MRNERFIFLSMWVQFLVWSLISSPFLSLIRSSSSLKTFGEYLVRTKKNKKIKDNRFFSHRTQSVLKTLEHKENKLIVIKTKICFCCWGIMTFFFIFWLDIFCNFSSFVTGFFTIYSQLPLFCEMDVSSLLNDLISFIIKQNTVITSYQNQVFECGVRHFEMLIC